jgi:fructose-1,6-bisphosphatase/inositol monophosphatase family enzyme
VQVKKGDTLTWTVDPVDGHTYTINFPKSSPVSSSSVPTGQSQTVNGDVLCTTLGWINTSLCRYSYNPVQDSKTTCPDPGVHVVP